MVKRFCNGYHIRYSVFIFQGTTNAQPVQWVPTYRNDSYHIGMWSAEGIELINKENNEFITETKLTNLGQTKAKVFQLANFGILLVSPMISFGRS